MTHLFCNWRFVPLTLPHLFLSSPNILPLWQSPVCFLQLRLCFCFLIFINLFCILDSTCKWNHTVSVILLSDTFRLILSRSIQIFADGKILFFIGSNVPLCLCICMSNIPCVNIHNGIIYSCMCACLVWKNTQKQNRWIECYSIFNFVRILHNVFHRAMTSLHSTIHQQWISAPVSPQPSQHLFSVFVVTDILTGVREYLTMVLICVSLMINDTEHLFTCLLTTCMFSLKKCLFRSSAHFLIRLFGFCDVELL